MIKLPEIRNKLPASNHEASPKQALMRVLRIFRANGIVDSGTNRLNISSLGSVKIADQLTSIEYIDLTGLESLTDYGVYMLAKTLKMNKSSGQQIRFNGVKLAACERVSVWSLHYLAVASGKGMLELHGTGSEVRVGERVGGCGRIDEDTIFMLENASGDYKG